MTASTGAGNDVVYTENTGTKALHNIDPDLGNDALLLHGRTVTVTITGVTGAIAAAAGVAGDEGFESAAIAITGTAANNYLTSQADYNNAIVEAINEDTVLSKLAFASINSNGTIDIQFLFDGITAAGAVNVDIGGNDVFGDITTASIWTSIESAYREEVGDSTFDVEGAYDAVDSLAVENSTVTTVGVDSIFATDNVINAGAGTDVVVLSTDVAGGTAATVSNDTVVFTGYAQGTTTIVNFIQGADTVGGDLLNFDAYLTSLESASGSVASRALIIATEDSDDTILVANELTTLEFEDGDNTALTGVVNFADLTEDNLLDLFDLTGATYPNNTSALVAFEGHAVVMVENNLNDGEYKMFHVEFSGDATEADGAGSDTDIMSITLIGTVDLGDSLTDISVTGILA